MYSSSSSNGRVVSDEYANHLVREVIDSLKFRGLPSPGAVVASVTTMSYDKLGILTLSTDPAVPVRIALKYGLTILYARTTIAQKLMQVFLLREAMAGRNQVSQETPAMAAVAEAAGCVFCIHYEHPSDQDRHSHLINMLHCYAGDPAGVGAILDRYPGVGIFEAITQALESALRSAADGDLGSRGSSIFAAIQRKLCRR